MAVRLKFIRHQLPVIAAIGRTAGQALRQGVGRRVRAKTAPLELPGPELTSTVPPRDPELVRAFVRHLGGDPSGYRGVLPPHLFPQWTFPVLTKTLADIPYPVMSLLNGGCRLQVNAPLPANEPLVTRARLAGIDDDGRRAILHQEVVTGTTSAPDALTIDFRPIIRLGGGKDKPAGEAKAKPTVPADAREIGRWRMSARAGLDFALLTGDFNPVHWVAPAARALGFKNVILHGFAEMGLAVEAMVRVLWAGDIGRLKVLDVRFVQPLVLPREIGAYVRLGATNELWVGEAAGGPAYMTGTFVAA
ncbi:MAG: hypothetical protein IT385_03510 [Deltaproteobacteria bacterium]|nr:hypothetical protein [Deltaproteobacteria bacterium]